MDGKQQKEDKFLNRHFSLKSNRAFRNEIEALRFPEEALLM